MRKNEKKIAQGVVEVVLFVVFTVVLVTATTSLYKKAAINSVNLVKTKMNTEAEQSKMLQNNARDWNPQYKFNN